MPLNEFEATVKEKSGCGVLAMTEAEWAMVKYVASVPVTGIEIEEPETTTITVAVPDENPGSDPDGNSNGNTLPVPTGDSTNAGMWVVLMISGLLAAIIAGRQEMKKAKASK